ncbi:hypothetical protein [uncultured Mediterranean phage uvMED]|nr:hypothetical protein [uncultured Mediterranean phage uvMED]
MGGPSGGNSGGGGNNNTTKFGYKKPKSTIQKVGDYIKGGGIVGSVIRGVKEGARKSKANVMDYEGQAAGVTPEKAPRDARTGRDNDNNNNQKSIEQPKVASQMDNTEVKSDLITADKTAPTDVEMTDDELLLKRKRGRKTKTVLTSVTGDTSKATLSKKTLLGG